mgnify:CR=1 FL=1
MDILPLEDGGVRFLDMPSAFYEQMTLLPETCDPDGDPIISSRLFPHPIDDEEPESVREAAEEDWTEFVRPELVAAFDGALRIVMEGLASARVLETEEDPYYQFEISREHVPGWYQVLNRARIVLAIKYRLPLSEFPPGEGEKIPLQRLFAAHLTEHYAQILEILAYQMSNELSEGDPGPSFQDSP